MMKFSFSALLLLAVWGSLAAAQVLSEFHDIERDGERARAEILRRGDMFERVGSGPRSAESELFAQAMEPPADDNDRWFISVISMQDCKPCAQLKRDFVDSDYLRALGNPEDPDLSWSHLNFYDKDDASQQFRWKGVKFKGYPTILVQAPRSKRFGDPGTVVDQITGYNGDDAALAKRITASIRLYVKKLSERRDHARAIPYRRVSYNADDDGPPRPTARDREQEPVRRVSVDFGQRTPPWSPRPRDEPPDFSPAPGPNPFDVPLFPFDQPPDDGGKKPDEGEKKPDEKKPDAESQLPEAVLVLDSQNEQPVIEAQAKRLLQRLREERKPLRVRITDFAFAKDLDVKRDETPAVVIRDGERIEKISGRILPLLAPEPVQMAPVTIWDLPVESLIAVFGGGGVLAAIPLITWGLRFIRSRRKESGKALVVQDDKRFEELLQFVDVVRHLDIEKLKAQFRKAPSA